MSMSSTGSQSTETAAMQVTYPWLTCYPPGVDWNMPFTPEPLFRLMERAVALDLYGRPVPLTLPWWVWNMFGEQGVFLLSRGANTK